MKQADVRRWLEGHRAAQVVVAAERRAWLRSLDADAALQCYVSLAALVPSQSTPIHPSPLLLSMRQTVARRNERLRE